MYWIDTDPAGRHVILLSVRSREATRILDGLDNPSDIAVSPEEGYNMQLVYYRFTTQIYLCNYIRLHHVARPFWVVVCARGEVCVCCYGRIVYIIKLPLQNFGVVYWLTSLICYVY